METTLVTLAIAFLSGSLVDQLIYNLRKAYGVLRIDHSSSEKDVYRFEIDNLDVLSKKKFIVLKVDNNANLSQK